MALKLQHGKTVEEEIRWLRKQRDNLQYYAKAYQIRRHIKKPYKARYERLLCNGEYAGISRTVVQYYDAENGCWTSAEPEYDQSLPLTTPPAAIAELPVLQVAQRLRW